MPRGYRCIILAAVGWLALGGASPSGNTSQREETGPKEEIANSVDRVADALDEANKPKRETTDCAKGTDDRRSDLCAQWKAADAAAQAADAADSTVTIGWFGLALAAITMGAAIAAAYFAKKAAEHTETGALEAAKGVFQAKRAAEIAKAALAETRKEFRAARLDSEAAAADSKALIKASERNASNAARAAFAAGDANNTAKEAMQRQLRPHVYLQHLGIEIGHMHGVGFIADTVEVTVYVKNFGQSPAKAVQMFVGVSIGGQWNDRPQADLPTTIIHLADIPQSEVAHQGGFSCHGLKLEHPDICAGTRSIFIEGQIQYADAFGNAYACRFQRALTGKNYETDPPAITPHWNEAWQTT